MSLIPQYHGIARQHAAFMNENTQEQTKLKIKQDVNRGLASIHWSSIG